jgi:hypothetical protein
VTIEKFETKPVLVKMNKLKPYKYMEFEVQKKKHNKCQYIGKKMQVEFRRQILTHRRTDVKYRNHR